jgi:hypothetical protein
VVSRILTTIESSSFGLSRRRRGSCFRQGMVTSCIMIVSVLPLGLVALIHAASVQAAGFEHAGRQCYAYVLARAGICTFDWVSLQLYESFSRFQHDTTRCQPPLSQAEAIIARAEAFSEGFFVHMPSPYLQKRSAAEEGSAATMPEVMEDIWNSLKLFGDDCVRKLVGSCRRLFGLSSQMTIDSEPDSERVEQQDGDHWVILRVQVPIDKLVIGVANGWADGEKVCRVHASELSKVSDCLRAKAQSIFL